MRCSMLTAAALLGCGAAPVLAQEAASLEVVPEPAAREESGSQRAGEPIHDVESLLGVPVFNALDEEIAEVGTLLVQGDRIIYARLGMGGFLGLGGQEIVIPFSLLSFRSSESGRGETELQAVIETVQTPDQLKALVEPDEIGD